MDNNTSSYQYPLSYKGNVVWLILFLLIFPPLGVILLFLNLCFRKDGICYSLKYRGSKFWLIFWTIVFFPIAIFLGLIRGFDVISDNQ